MGVSTDCEAPRIVWAFENRRKQSIVRFPAYGSIRREFNFAAYGCDVDSLSEICAKTLAGYARILRAHVECGNPFVDYDSTDRTNA